MQDGLNIPLRSHLADPTFSRDKAGLTDIEGAIHELAYNQKYRGSLRGRLVDD